MKYILIIFAFIFVASTPMWVPMVTDNTLTGLGIEDSPLKVDTSVIATPFDIIAATRGSEISPAQITSDQDNYNPSGWDDATVVRLDGDSGIRAITSFAAPTTSLKPQEKTLILVGSFPIYYPGEHTDGTAANRIAATQDIIHYPGQSVRIVYDQTSLRWRVQSSDGYTKPTIFYSYSAGSSIAGDFGDFSLTAINSGAFGNTSSTTSLPGSINIRTQATTTGGGEIYFAKTIGWFTAFGSAHIFAEAIVSIPTLSDATNTFTSEVQILTTSVSTSLEPNNTFGVRYSHGINSGKWELFSQGNTGTESVADLGITVSAATRYKIRLEVDKSKTECRAYINGVYAGRVTSNLPNTGVAGTRIVHLKSAGTTTRILSVHSFNAGAIYP